MKRRNTGSNVPPNTRMQPTEKLGGETAERRHRINLRQRIERLWTNKGAVTVVSPEEDEEVHNDALNYALLIILYTIQGIPMGLSASIPFLIQQKMASVASTSAVASSRSSYNANAMFSLCSWPFSLKLLWAPIVDACFIPSCGRRKSWLVPVQSCAGLLLVTGAKYVERQLMPSSSTVAAVSSSSTHVRGVTAYFFALYFLMATQDIAVDGWALTLLSPPNRGRGPVCNSIGQNIGYFISFVGFLALNDAEACEKVWRPLLRLPSRPGHGLVSLGVFLKCMGYFVLATTLVVALFKHEAPSTPASKTNDGMAKKMDVTMKSTADEDAELDASEIGLVETYHRLWAVCQLPAVRWLFVVLLTYRLPTSLGDNVKFLKAVEYGLSKSTTALLSPLVVLPLGILVPIIATKLWNDAPLQQFMTAYKARVTIVPLLDVLLLVALRNQSTGTWWYWALLILSTAGQAAVQSAQMNAQMTFFAKRVDPAIGGSYMTLLNTAANMGGTWPAPVVMGLLGMMSSSSSSSSTCPQGATDCSPTSVTWMADPYFGMQAALSVLGCVWIVVMGKRVQQLSQLPEEAWRTDANIPEDRQKLLKSVDVELSR